VLELEHAPAGNVSAVAAQSEGFGGKVGGCEGHFSGLPPKELGEAHLPEEHTTTVLQSGL
jgi:hypothetical protein